VQACPAKARIFGNVSDPLSEISRLLATNRVQVLKSYLGTRPRTRYIGLDSEVI
jgi:Fe-S-cluster-containing dehydrogenase component